MHKIVLGDALEYIKKIPDNSIDLIFIDPPYNTTDLSLDKHIIPEDFYNVQLKRILKPNGWFFCFGVLEMFCVMMQVWRRKFEYIWCKSSNVPRTHNTIRPNMQHELICAFIHPELKRINDLYFDSKSLRTIGEPYERLNRINRRTGKLNPLKKMTEYRRAQRCFDKTAPIINDGYREGTTLLHYPAKVTMSFRERNDHPTQKPLKMCQVIVQGYCPVDGVVFDPFMGSGTIPVAAKTTGRKYIGVEINESYYNMAQNRLNTMMDGYCE